MKKIVVKNLVKAYNKKTVLSYVNIEMRGGVYALLGPNGAGKSTLISLLVDSIQNYSGDILYGDENIKKLGKDYRKKVGYVPQKQSLYEEFSVLECMNYIAALKGLKKREVRDEISYLLERLHIMDVVNRKISTLSGGMKQRVLMVQALLGNPDFVILDEPTVGLDPVERYDFRNFVKELSEKCTILYATHVVSDVEDIAKEVILIKSGEIIVQDTAHNLILNLGKTHENIHNLEDAFVYYTKEAGR
ncbi:ATP-binding cassette domain-containing protein [Eubacterium sp. MSJ-13]|uniref:ABC transporter ATP-binding protein n=1 Tax=Eubacterium sp. MSJ-13 TaxID=2841513 RepID=UPI001C125D04|nr:ATP-binding cassette domain-containing protein [Eubacterium sp. MSJ-13]MBU5478028.1 ATP-binding cassette domain-containing protein [Eubacterium sp. MSJ-13]